VLQLPAVAVVGPTASGKSAVALAASRARPGTELVSVDALQVYRGLDVGTAKPSPQERAEVPHHLIDLVGPSEPFTVAEFQHALAAVRTDLEQRHVIPIYVGGTGLYLRAVVDGLDLPGDWPELRAELEAEVAATGPEVLHARLAEIDPAAAAKMEPTNARRVVRALEVCLGSGRPFSSYGAGLDAYPPSPVSQVGLRWHRDVLLTRIEARVDAMLAAGFVAEVEHLLADPAGLSRTAAQALGYAEIADHLHGLVGLDETRDLIVLRTRQLAVRQERWFRRDPRIRWVEVEADPVAEALPTVLGELDRISSAR
jgi:tRNA dimethylallyltransferase